MSDKILVELGSKNGAAWNRIFEKFTKVICNSADAIVDGMNDEEREATTELSNDIAGIVKDYASAKMNRPGIENDAMLADIQLKFEQIKTARVMREQQEVITESKRLELIDQRLQLAIKWLGFLHTHTVTDQDGNVTLVLTNDELSELMVATKSLKSGE